LHDACASHANGDLRGTEDPLGAVGRLPRSAAERLSTDRFVLTLPLACRQ